MIDFSVSVALRGISDACGAPSWPMLRPCWPQSLKVQFQKQSKKNTEKKDGRWEGEEGPGDL